MKMCIRENKASTKDCIIFVLVSQPKQTHFGEIKIANAFHNPL